jgi:hypothetical protein
MLRTKLHGPGARRHRIACGEYAPNVALRRQPRDGAQRDLAAAAEHE